MLRSLLLLLLPLTLTNGTGRKEGFSSLKILPGAREAGMGGSGVAVAFGPQAIALNPAAVAEFRTFGVAVGYTDWLLDTRLQSVFAGRKLSWLAVAVGVVSFTGGQFEYRLKPSDEPLGTFEPTDLSVYTSLGRMLGRKVSFGLTGRFFTARLLEHSASGFGIDVGLRLRPIAGVALGASLVDFGRTPYYEREVFWLPTRVRLGAGYDWRLAAQLRLALALDGSYYLYQKGLGGHFGLELVWNDMLAIRGGYEATAGVGRMSGGLGLRSGLFGVDYALASLAAGFGVVQRFGVSLGR